MRECGVLLPVSSLPSRYGIGAFSKEAYQFIDQLEKAGQQYWQILPVGPTGFGDSPYQSFSAFAGNPYLIDLEQLIQEGLLTKKECRAVDFGSDARSIDYGKLYEGRFPLLRQAYQRWRERLPGGGTPEEVHALAENKLGAETREYCFYMAVKNRFQSASWDRWDEDIRLRKPKAVRRYRELLTDEIGFYEFQQITFEKQWRRLKRYAAKHGIRIIGDIPIYVAYDGADSWAHPELFQLDEEGRPRAVAGCPPDAFSATGQLWGNPLYDWAYHEQTEYAWWMERMAYSLRLYDVVRVDHFRGFESYYAIPYGDATAEFGHWEPGPGIRIFERLKAYTQTEKLPIIAEDLGFLTPAVHELLRDTGFPGMKVLEFAFDDSEDSAYLPHRYTENCVVYTGTHDNDTLRGWYRAMEKRHRKFAAEYMGCRAGSEKRFCQALIRLALSSVARLAIIPVQDYLGLDSEARINEPSTLGKNWRWRMLPGELDGKTLKRCRRLNELYGRTKRL